MAKEEGIRRTAEHSLWTSQLRLFPANNNFFCPLLETFCHFQTYFPVGVSFCRGPYVSSFCQLSSSGQERGLGWGGVGFVACEGWEQNIGWRWYSGMRPHLGKLRPIWAKWDPSGQFVLKMGKSALELGGGNSIIFQPFPGQEGAGGCFILKGWFCWTGQTGPFAYLLYFGSLSLQLREGLRHHFHYFESSENLLQSYGSESLYFLQSIFKGVRTHDLPSWVGSNHCRFAIVILDTAVQTQHLNNYIVKNPVTLMVQSFLVFWHFLVLGQSSSQLLWKCWWKEKKEPSASPWTIGSWKVWIKSFWAAQLTLLFQLAQKFIFNSSASFSTLSMQ